MEPWNFPCEPLNLLVVVRRSPKLVVPACDTPHSVFYLPVVNAFLGFGSILSSHMLLFEANPLYEKQSPPHVLLARGLEKVLCSYYPLAGRLRACVAVGRGGSSILELVCNGQGGVFVEAQANISLAELRKMDKVYWSELQYDFVGETTTEVPPLVIQVTTLTCGGFVVSIRVLHSLLDSAGMLHFLHAWSEMTKVSHLDVASTTIPIWGGMVPTQLGPWPQRFHFPSLDLVSAQEDYGHDQKNLSMESRDHQPFLENTHPLSNISISLDELRNLKDSIRRKCNKFEALAAMFLRERARGLGLHPSSEAILFFPAPVAHDVHLAFYGQYAFNCMVTTKVGDLIRSDFTEIVQIIQEAEEHLEENFVECMRKFAQVQCQAKCAPAHVFIFTLLWDGVSEIDFGMGTTPYAPDALRLHSPINVAAITGGLEDTIEIVMTNAPLNMADKISLNLHPPHSIFSDSRL